MNSIYEHLNQLVGKEIEIFLQGKSVIGVLQPVNGANFINLKPTVTWLESLIVHVSSISAIKVYAPRDLSKDDDGDSNQCEDSGVK